MIAVTNKNEDAFVARFDGREYAFQKGEPTVIDERAAAFFFAYGLPDAARARVLVRNGWQKNGDPTDDFGPKAALKRLQNFIFRSVAETPRVKPPYAKLPDRIVSKAEDGSLIEHGTMRIPGRSAPLAPHSGTA